jgi:predicted AAA+ superfamily ATPase
VVINHKLFKKVCEYNYMKAEEIKRVVVSQREEVEEKFKRENIVKREPNIDHLRKFLEKPNILVILGIRRCGKSIFSWQIMENLDFGYINFDDERLYGIKAKDLDKVLQAFYELYGNIDYFIFDELQNVDGWELFVNRLRVNKKTIITGSNSRLLSGELATHLTGRYIDFTLMPFSFREFLNLNNVEISKETFFSTSKLASIKRFLEEFLKKGGLPESYLLGREFLIRLYSDIIEKDVVKRIKVRKVSALKEIAKYLVSISASEFSINKLSNIFEVKDNHTLKNWIEALQNSYLFFTLHRYSPKLKEQIIAPRKVYCMDSGIVSTVGFKLSENFGKLMENLVAVELLRRKNYWFKEWEIYYWRDYQQREVDFVIKDGLKVKQLIQVTYASGKDEIEEREIRALIKASDLLKCEDLLIITWDYEDEIEVENKKIIFKPLWKWLLQI